MAVLPKPNETQSAKKLGQVLTGGLILIVGLAVYIIMQGY